MNLGICGMAYQTRWTNNQVVVKIWFHVLEQNQDSNKGMYNGPCLGYQTVQRYGSSNP